MGAVGASRVSRDIVPLQMHRSAAIDGLYDGALSQRPVLQNPPGTEAG